MAVGLVVRVRHVQRECDIVSRERCSIAPLNAVADVDRHTAVVIVVGVVGGHPRDEFAGEHVEVEQSFAAGLVETATRETAGVRVEVLDVGEGTGVFATETGHDKCPVSGDVLVSEGNGSRGHLNGDLFLDDLFDLDLFDDLNFLLDLDLLDDLDFFLDDLFDLDFFYDLNFLLDLFDDLDFFYDLFLDHDGLANDRLGAAR